MWFYKVVRLIACIIRFIERITRPYFELVLDILSVAVMGKTKILPPIDNEILLISATELAEKIRKRQITCEEVVQAYVKRSQSVHAMINAVVDERYEEAVGEAREVDHFLAITDKTEEEIARETPLLGVPFTVKEAAGVKGLAQTAGIYKARNRKADQDGDATALCRNAGAIPIAVTNVPELLFWWDSSNRIFGRTKNPYNNRRAVGGSTGGEGAIIASAGSVFGVGTDIGGSIRIPAAFNGIYGHKPSRGVISNLGVFPYRMSNSNSTVRTAEFSTTGPMCRYAKDLPLLLRVMSDNDARIKLDEKVDFKKLTVYYMEEMPGYLVSSVPVVKSAIVKAVAHFEKEHGIKPIKLTLKELSRSIAIFQSKLLEYGSPPFQSFLAGGEGKTLNLTSELFKNLLGLSDHTLHAIFYAMIEIRDQDQSFKNLLEIYEALQRKINEVLDEKEAVLLIPTHPEPAPHVWMTIPKFSNVGYTAIFNILGLPSTNIPAGLSCKGLPFGIQAVSGRFNDRISLATAIELDNVFGGWKSPCLINC